MQVALAMQPAVLAPCGGDAAHLAMFVGWVADPVDAGVSTDDLVRWVYKYNLVILVSGVLINPVGIENPEATTGAANAFFSEGPQVLCRL